MKGGQESLVRSGMAFIVAFASLIAFGVTNDQEARDQGFFSDADRRQANEAGYEEASDWVKVRAELEANDRAAAQVPAVAQKKVPTAIGGLASYVAEVAQHLPSQFEDHGTLITEEARMRPLADDVLAYGRFYWVVDSIENNCRYLGQRTNIEMLSPKNGVSSWITTASMLPQHPNYADYIEIFEKFSTAVSEFGEATVCPAMYRLLGPDGSLMEEAKDINGLIDPEVLYRYEVRVQDGVLWSSKDYCERRYYLEQEPQESLHDMACNEAEAQDF